MIVEPKPGDAEEDPHGGLRAGARPPVALTLRGLDQPLGEAVPVDGVVEKLAFQLMPSGSMIEVMEAKAAKIGEATIAICDAMTVTDSGREGRTVPSSATTTMTGSVEKAGWPVSAKTV